MVEFKIEYNERINEKLTAYQTKETKSKLSKIALSSVIVCICLIAYGIFEKQNEFYKSVFFIFGVSIIVFYVTLFLLLKGATKKQIKKNNETIISDKTLTVETLKFDEEKVFIFTNRGDFYRSAIETNYDYFCKAIEYDDSFILFVSNIMCHVIFKDCITKGTIEEFENLLKHNVKNFIAINNDGSTK